MIKKIITPLDVVDLLNELLKTDREAILSLFKIRVICNKQLAKHPSVQVLAYGNPKNYMVGFTGILNGLFGADENGWGCIAANYKGAEIKKFILLKDRLKNG